MQIEEKPCQEKTRHAVFQLPVVILLLHTAGGHLVQHHAGGLHSCDCRTDMESRLADINLQEHTACINVLVP